MRPAAAIEALLGRAEGAFLGLANGLLVVMLVINLANILSRLVLDIGIIWVFPWTEVLFVWMIFFAFFVIYRRGQDVTIDVLTRRLPPALRRAAQVFVALAVLVLMGLILAQAPVLLPRQVGRIDMVGIQRYWLILPFFLSCTLIALDFLMRLLAALGLVRGAGDGPA